MSTFNVLAARDLLELKIPKSECVIGDVAHPYTGVKLIDELDMRNHGVELVSRCIRKEWVISRYSPSSVNAIGLDWEGNEVEEIRTLYSPIFTSSESLFDQPMKVSGDGYAEKNYDRFSRVISYEDSGMDLATWLSRADFTLVQDYLNNVATRFEYDPSLIKMGSFYQRLITRLQEDVYDADVCMLLDDCAKHLSGV